MELAKCIKCGKEQNINDDFYWCKGRRQAKCKTCQKKYVKVWHQRHEAKIKANKEADQIG